MDELHEPLLAFDRSAHDFTLGVEIGMIWQRCQSEQLPITAVVHAANAEMALRIGEAVGASVRADDLDDDWLNVTYY